MISCICLTYGRPRLLEEAIESFIRQQTDVKREMIVVNDHPEQELVCKVPYVQVINLPRRIRTLGEKRNFAVSLARYDRILTWDDDDIYLPWRLAVTEPFLREGHFFKCPRAWVSHYGHLSPQAHFNLFHSASSYSRDVFARVGGYRMMNGGEDMDFEQRVRALGYRQDTLLPNDQIYYIYRWGHGSYHTTGVHDLEQISPEVEKGRVVLTPRWEQDYVYLVQNNPGYSSYEKPH